MPQEVQTLLHVQPLIFMDSLPVMEVILRTVVVVLQAMAELEPLNSSEISILSESIMPVLRLDWLLVVTVAPTGSVQTLAQ